MSDLRDLYQQVILDHNRNPRNACRLEHANHQSNGFNPLCGDRITLYLEVENGRVVGVGFEGSGCAISQASASMMTESIKGKTTDEALALFDKFREMVTGEGASTEVAAELGKLTAFEGVSEFPARVKCATLAWHTLAAALRNEKDPVSTE
ncbi:MAG: Fe-S cluster assembly sulfur transfer protein SufU [Planctomycetota bacterium]